MNKKLKITLIAMPIGYALFAVINDFFALNMLNKVPVFYDKISYGFSLLCLMFIAIKKIKKQNTKSS